MQAERVGREGELVQVVDSRSTIILYYKTEADRALYISDLETQSPTVTSDRAPAPATRRAAEGRNWHLGNLQCGYLRLFTCSVSCLAPVAAFTLPALRSRHARRETRGGPDHPSPQLAWGSQHLALSTNCLLGIRRRQ